MRTAGVYDVARGDGRELVVSDPCACRLCAEDGRSVSCTDISPFLKGLPSAADGGGGAGGGEGDAAGWEVDGGAAGGATAAVTGAVTHVTADVAAWSTACASGATSQAASLVEALEAGASLLLLDEDSSAANFMCACAPLRVCVSRESRFYYLPVFGGLICYLCCFGAAW